MARRLLTKPPATLARSRTSGAGPLTTGGGPLDGADEWKSLETDKNLARELERRIRRNQRRIAATRPSLFDPPTTPEADARRVVQRYEAADAVGRDRAALGEVTRRIDRTRAALGTDPEESDDDAADDRKEVVYVVKDGRGMGPADALVSAVTLGIVVKLVLEYFK